MKHETPPRSRPSPPTGGRSGTGRSEQSPLQCRARFLENWDWKAITDLNRRLCEGQCAQHGPNSESNPKSQKEWEALQKKPLTFLEVVEHLQGFHRKAPFLFFNGNTFAELGRGLSYALFADIAAMRKKQLASLVAHFIAGVPEVDKAALRNGLRELTQLEDFQVGDKVTTLQKSLSGEITRINPDGGIVWKCNQTGAVMTGTPQSLLPLR
jgi:hypothetical protein